MDEQRAEQLSARLAEKERRKEQAQVGVWRPGFGAAWRGCEGRATSGPPYKAGAGRPPPPPLTQPSNRPTAQPPNHPTARAQAKLEEERRAVAAAREATRERQAALVEATAAHKLRLVAQLGSRIEERLREAATRRWGCATSFRASFWLGPKLGSVCL